MDFFKAFFSKYRVQIAAILALILVAITGGVITLSPNTGDEVQIIVPVPGADDDDSGDSDLGDDDSGAASPISLGLL